jgi:serine/threonine protein kinase
MEERVATKTSDSAAPPALGKYAPFARLGQGGMADVFLAVARGPVGFNKLAVVKRLRNPDDVARLDMFLDEARLSARLSHPNIVNTYEVGEAKGQYFIAMEYLEGQPLQAIVSSKNRNAKPLDETSAAFIAMQSLKGLHYAHELTDYDGTPIGVVHRDVSPHNLFITYQGEVKLLDFGIAKAALNSTQTETGVLKGKIRYMAPEQIGERNVDRRADVYALGIVLWEMVAGRPLYRGDVTSILTKIAMEDPPLLRSVRDDISPELEAIVGKALRRNLDERYPTADAMRVDLEVFLRGKQDGADATLARMMNDLFAETRDAVRARIKTFLAELPASGSAASAPNLAQAAELLPALFGDAGGTNSASGSGSGSGAGRNPNASASGSNNAFLVAPSLVGMEPPPSSSRRLWWSIAAGGALLIAGFVLLRPKPAPPPAPVTVPAALAPAAVASTTRVHLESSPDGALVEWNGRPLARTPADVELPAGTQTLKLTTDGFEPEEVTIDVKPQEPTARAVVLRPKVEPAPAPTPAPAAGGQSWHRGGGGGGGGHRAPEPAPPPRPPVTAAASPAPTPTATASVPRAKIRVVGDDDAP